jgi:hypothetical protein
MNISIGKLVHTTLVAVAVTLSACGGGSSSSGSGIGSTTPPPSFTIGGVVSGLSGSVVLQNNSGDDLTVSSSSSGNFTFATSVANGGTYSVSVKIQPSGQNCTVSNGSGNVSAVVSKIAVTCATLASKLSVVFSPSLGTPLLSTDTLTVTFAQAMNSGTATITPSGGTWNTAKTSYTFPALAAGSFDASISATSAAGDKQVSLSNVSFNVYGSAATSFVYVSPSGNDTTGTGALATPYATIAKAVSVAVSGQAVLVAGGTYTVNSGAATSTNIVVKDGVSLYGGYAANFASRDPAVNVTTITDVATAAAPSLIATDFGVTTGGLATPGVPRAALSVGALTVPVTIDGFTINGSTTASTVNSTAVGINNTGAGILTLTNNTLKGGAGTAFSVGVYSVNGTYVVGNDIVEGGSSAGMSFGLYTGAGTVNAQYSSIKGGSGASNVAVFNDDLNTISTNLSNNVIVGGSGANSYGVYSVPGSSYPAVLLNNSIVGGSGTATSTAIFAADSVYQYIFNNTIDGGSGAISKGIDLTGFSYSAVVNNTISGGSGTTSSTAIFNSTGGYADIEDNILFVSATSGSRICYNNVDGDGIIAITRETFNNNDLSPSCATALYSYVGADVTSVSAPTTVYNAATTLSALGIVSVAPTFVSASDWHLTASSPAAVLQGGSNMVGSTLFSLGLSEPVADMDGIIRTPSLTLSPANKGATGISMGAYEKN